MSKPPSTTPTDLIGVISSYSSIFIVYEIRFTQYNGCEKIITPCGVSTIDKLSYMTVYTTNKNKINKIIQTNRHNNTSSIVIIKHTHFRREFDTIKFRESLHSRSKMNLFFETSSETIAEHKYDVKKNK